MSTEQLMLRDVIFELHDILDDIDNEEESTDYRAGVARVAGLLEYQLKAFDVDQSRYARKMPDIEGWWLRGKK